MTGWDLRVDLQPPDGASPAERRAGAALLGAWLTDVLPPRHPGGLVEQLDPNGIPASLLMVDWLAPVADPTAAIRAARDHLNARIPHNPATAGWTVTVIAETADPGRGPQRTGSPLSVLDGPTLADTVLAAAPLFTAIPAADLWEAFTGDPDNGDQDNGDQDNGDLHRQLKVLSGALIVAATLATDELFDDLATLALGGTVADTTALIDLPPQFDSHYTNGFARSFLVAFLDLTSRLTAEQWDPPSCVAQELGVRILLDRTGLVADLAGLDLAADWRETMAELLLEDLDHEYLYDPALDGFEDDPDFGPPGMVSMRVQDWFQHFAGNRPLPPYLA